ncbi:MAG TPA: LLM class flavin-dependent oxidoreductase [Solirubrobacteraceae bacterium]
MLRALPRSYQVTPDIPGPATSDTAKGGQTPNGADSLKESQLAAGPRPSPRHRTSPTPRITTASLKEAKLYTRAASRPRLYVSAFGPQAAQIAARYGDGLWTMGDPESAPEVIDAYLEARARDGQEAGEIILQSGFNLAEDEETAIASTRKWKATQLDEVYRDDLHDPAEMLAKAEHEVSDEQFAEEGFIVSADPSEHVERIRRLEAINDATTTIVLQLIGADPLGSIRRYAEHVLPALRGARTA